MRRKPVAYFQPAVERAAAEVLFERAADVLFPPPPILKTYIVGIDRVTREFYRIEAENEKEAETKLVQVVEGTRSGEEVQLDGSGDSELQPDSVGEAFEEPKGDVNE